MRLAFKVLDKVNNVNSFDEVNEIAFQSGNPTTLYFRLMNLEAPETCPDNGTDYLRFIPPSSGTSAVVKFDSIDSTNAASRVASQPYPLDDRSIFSVPILAGDKFDLSTMTVELTIGSETFVLRSLTEIRSGPSGSGRLFC